MRAPVLSVVIPALNEQDGIQEMVERVLSTKPELAKVGVADLELIVVDDGSTDGTQEIVEKTPGARLICHSANRGYGAAIKTGFHAASGDLLAFLDADGTYPPEFFPALCKEALDGADVVVGSRRSGEASQMPFVRRVGNLIWSGLVSLLSNAKVMDPASGMRVIRKEKLERLYPLPDGLNFTPVMTTRAVHEGIRFKEVPIPYEERQGRSKLSIIQDGARFLQTILWTALNYNPVRILGGVGVGLVLVSVLIILAFVEVRLSGVTTLGPVGVLGAFLALVFGLGGVSLFALGTTFNYLVSIFHKRPVRQGLFGRPIFKVPLDRQFWWMGLLGILAGVALGGVSFSLALGGWALERLWLYLLAGTMLVLVGSQLAIFWVIVRVLDELTQREVMVARDLEGREVE